MPDINPLTTDDLMKIIKDMQNRIKLLESRVITSISLKTGSLIIPIRTSDPSSPVAGQIYYNSATGKYRKYDSVAAAWKDFQTA